jgi:hypothetical protein
LEKCNDTKFKGVQLQDKHTLLEVRDLHHEDVVLISNLEMTPEVVIHSLVQLEARKTWPYATP